MHIKKSDVTIMYEKKISETTCDIREGGVKIYYICVTDVPFNFLSILIEMKEELEILNTVIFKLNTFTLI